MKENHRITDFLSEILKAKRPWDNACQTSKENSCQPKSPGKFPFRI
jgi:hypothetical protein